MWVCTYARVTASVLLCCRNNTKSLPSNNGRKAQGVALVPCLSVDCLGTAPLTRCGGVVREFEVDMYTLLYLK